MHMNTSSRISMVMFACTTFDPSEFNGCCEDDQMLKSSPMTIESTPLNHYKKYEVIDTWCSSNTFEFNGYLVISSGLKNGVKCSFVMFPLSTSYTFIG
jgi:hypothetical protein